MQGRLLFSIISPHASEHTVGLVSDRDCYAWARQTEIPFHALFFYCHFLIPIYHFQPIFCVMFYKLAACSCNRPTKRKKFNKKKASSIRIFLIFSSPTLSITVTYSNCIHYFQQMLIVAYQHMVLHFGTVIINVLIWMDALKKSHVKTFKHKYDSYLGELCVAIWMRAVGEMVVKANCSGTIIDHKNWQKWADLCKNWL